MNEKQLWKKLDQIALKKIAEFEKTTEMMPLICIAYDEELTILANCVETKPGYINQLYTGSSDKRLLICFTSKRQAEKSQKHYDSIYLKDVVDNVLEHEYIEGIIFNPFDDKATVMIPKFVLDICMNETDPKIYVGFEKGRLDPLDDISPVKLNAAFVRYVNNAKLMNAVNIFDSYATDEVKGRRKIEAELIENASSPEGIANLCRKIKDHKMRIVLAEKIIANPDSIPHMINWVCRATMKHLSHTAVLVLANADDKFTKDLFERYDDIRTDYAKAMMCTVFGFKNVHEDLLWSEYERLYGKCDDENNHLDQGPLLALWLIKRPDEIYPISMDDDSFITSIDKLIESGKVNEYLSKNR